MWLLPSVASADERFGIVTLDLQPDTGEVPTHLCVVSEAPRSARTQKRLWDVLEGKPERLPGSGSRLSWRVKPEVWNGDERSVESQRCTDSGAGDCRPRVELPEKLTEQADLYVACAADSLTEGSQPTEPRPLFILLEYLEGSPPQIESVRLTGGIATIGVFGPAFDRVVVTARSLGGHYLPHTRSQRGQMDPRAMGNGDDGGPRTKTVTLDLAARCRTVEVKLPRTRIKPADRARLEVLVHGESIDTGNCVSNLTGADVFQVRIPPAPLGVGSIDVELQPTGDQAGARFSRNFEGTWPVSPVALEFNQVTFTWLRPDCIYPRDQCPSATLETGTKCDATVTDSGCAYRCPGNVVDETAIDLQLPLDVIFDKTDPKQRWTDKLAQNGQELRSYVTSDQVYLSANINPWRTDIPDNEISAVEIYGEDGQGRRYGVSGVDRLLLKVPGASCESVRFTPKGDRNYEEVVATVQDGNLDFGDPQRAAKRVSFNFTLAVGGGPAWSGDIQTPPLYSAWMAMFAVQWRARRRNWNRLGFEFRTGGTLGSWATEVTQDQTTTDEEDGAMRIPPEGTTTDDTTTTTTSTRRRFFARARVLFEPGLVISLHQRVAVGTGFGLGFALPLQRDRDVTNESFTFIWSPAVDLRFRLRRWLKLMIQFRGIFGEQAFSVGPDQPLEGETARSLLFLVGLTASF
jgi:hypothetical protein